MHAAARVGALAEGGEIAVSALTLEGGAVPFEAGNEREVSLKGLADPVRVLSIEWRDRPDPAD
jgi:class 3 adenylate cyclase